MELPQLFTEYRPLLQPEFLASLRSLDFQQPKWLYGALTGEQPLQGDIFPELEIAWVDAHGGAEMYIGPAMLVGNSCDAVPDQDEVVAVAPVLTIEDFRERRAARPDLNSLEKQLRDNKNTSRMFLPGIADLPDSYVEFAYTGPVATARVVELFAQQRA